MKVSFREKIFLLLDDRYSDSFMCNHKAKAHDCYDCLIELLCEHEGEKAPDDSVHCSFHCLWITHTNDSY